LQQPRLFGLRNPWQPIFDSWALSRFPRLLESRAAAIQPILGIGPERPPKEPSFCRSQRAALFAWRVCRPIATPRRRPRNPCKSAAFQRNLAGFPAPSEATVRTFIVTLNHAKSLGECRAKHRLQSHRIRVDGHRQPSNSSRRSPPSSTPRPSAQGHSSPKRKQTASRPRGSSSRTSSSRKRRPRTTASLTSRLEPRCPSCCPYRPEPIL